MRGGGSECGEKKYGEQCDGVGAMMVERRWSAAVFRGALGCYRPSNYLQGRFHFSTPCIEWERIALELAQACTLETCHTPDRNTLTSTLRRCVCRGTLPPLGTHHPGNMAQWQPRKGGMLEV